jgi:hypothetical protein
MDLTTLNSDDTPGRVERLCAKARHPVMQDILDGLGVGDLTIQPAAVCVYHAFVATAVKALEGTSIPVAAVSTAFPHGLAPVDTKLREIVDSVAAGAKEIDIVIERQMVLNGDWQALYDQIKSSVIGCRALAHSRSTRPGVSSELSVVRSIRVMALSGQAACHSFLTVRRVPIVAARRSSAERFMRTRPTQSRSSGYPGLRAGGVDGLTGFPAGAGLSTTLRFMAPPIAPEGASTTAYSGRLVPIPPGVSRDSGP